MQKIIIPFNEKESLEVFCYTGSFNSGLAVFEDAGLELITARELAEVRLHANPESPVTEFWTYIAENFNYFPNGDVLIASRNYNPFLKSPRDRIATSSSSEEFYLNKEVIKHLEERAETNPEEAILSGVLRLTLECDKDKAAGEAISRFFFQDLEEAYLSFVQNLMGTIPPFLVANKDYVKGHKEPFARPFYIDGILDMKIHPAYLADRFAKHRCNYTDDFFDRFKPKDKIKLSDKGHMFAVQHIPTDSLNL